jgi:hypothetical protein
MLFFALTDSMVDSFNSRASALKQEFDVFFDIILNNLIKAKSLILNFSFFNLKVLRLFNSIFFEFVFYFSNYSVFFFTKFNFLKYKFNNLLATASSTARYISLAFYNKVLPSFFSKLLVWKTNSTIAWIRPRILASKSLLLANTGFNPSFWFLKTSINPDPSLFVQTFNSNFSIKNTK